MMRPRDGRLFRDNFHGLIHTKDWNFLKSLVQSLGEELTSASSFHLLCDLEITYEKKSDPANGLL